MHIPSLNRLILLLNCKIKQLSFSLIPKNLSKSLLKTIVSQTNNKFKKCKKIQILLSEELVLINHRKNTMFNLNIPKDYL